ncbi:hypothetical protein BO70DRAFT_382305 [Aspergillus heteromorphus CBS 117.55]|uniref:CRIB domain-containing protein n=1 Tax=Aspergillus heteromorphus CBS 117.55 TaxID=1448321 RepID=A0A317V9Z2_9EURO|nr:uncharacterized protein BO70DRAFT_382305 [Aspergillus heteromorphus CBS 117.55]PWY70169.1 hypothetical protein BO70DRAFT_382305 [Aspergillus heteromorphus CBS 117.55]
MSQQDLDRSYARASNNESPEQYSVHSRSRSTANAPSPKRLSVFSGRSRSNTTNSTTSSRRSPASSMTSTDAASLPLHEDRAGSVSGVRHERPESVTKSLLSRGSRILRRQGSKFHIVSTLDEEDEVEREKPRFEVSDIFGRHNKPRPSDAHDQLKSLISDPFDFHHLTHTSPSQFQSLEKARETDLVTEFSAIRASQRPVANLKGIRAQDLHFRGFSAEDLTQCKTTNDNDGHMGPSASPPASPGGSSSVSPKQRDVKASREPRVFENFSRPVPRIPKTGTTTPPPRASSPRLACSPELPEPAPRAIDEILGLSTQPTYPEHVYSHVDDIDPSTSWSQMHMEDMFPASSGYALTTGGSNDIDTARTSSMSLPTLSSDLEDVPEEEETTPWHDDSELHTSEISPRALVRVSRSDSVEVQSASMAGPKSDLSIYVAEDLSRKFAEALGSPTLPQHRLLAAAITSPPGPPTREPAQTQFSVNKTAIHESTYESWDADIDYCYEHAAESNSNFDWTRTSFDEPRQEDAGVTVTVPDESHGFFESAHLTASELSIDLDPNSSQLAPSSHVVSRYTLDDDVRLAVTQRDSDYFRPVRFAPTLGKHINTDSLYEDYLTADAESDRHFSFYSQTGVIQPMEQSVSPRSSFSPISKCNSQESLILSRAASIVRKHRSSVSTASVPELVHSLASSRELHPSEQRLSGEHSGMTRPDSSHHRQTKSLARELEAQILYRADDSSHELAGQASTVGPSIYDRARSTTEVEAAPLIARAIKNDTAFRAAPRRKGRASYSLFPTPAAN